MRSTVHLKLMTSMIIFSASLALFHPTVFLLNIHFSVSFKFVPTGNNHIVQDFLVISMHYVYEHNTLCLWSEGRMKGVITAKELGISWRVWTTTSGKHWVWNWEQREIAGIPMTRVKQRWVVQTRLIQTLTCNSKLDTLQASQYERFQWSNIRFHDLSKANWLKRFTQEKLR